MKSVIIEGINNSLLNYVSINRKQGEINSFLVSHNLTTLYLDYLKKHNMNIYKEALTLIKHQDDRYSFFLKEIKYIVEQSEASGIDIYFMKGIILADDLFVNHSQRKSMDMDLLVSYDNLETAHRLLLVLGYIPNGDDSYTNSLACVQKYGTIREEITHITSYYKPVKVDDGTDKILYADLHIKPYHYMPLLASGKFRSIFSRTKKVYVSLIGKEIPTLGTMDTFIHLSAHFIRHYYWEFLKFTRTNQSFVFRVELLNEIALYFYLHKAELENCKVVDLAVELNQIEPLYYTMLVINHIHKNIINDEILCYAKKKFNENRGLCGISSKFVGSLINSDLDKQINLQNYELANYIYQAICDEYDIGNISRDRDNLCVEDLKTTIFNLNKTEVLSEEHRKKIYSEHLTVKKSTVAYSWSVKSLNITIKNERMTNPDIVRISLAKNTTLNCDQEFLEIKGKNYNVYSKTIEISLEKDDFAVVFNGKLIDKTKINFQIINGEIIVKIPFILLNFNASVGRVINLQTVLLYFIKNEEINYLMDYTRYYSENYMPFEPWICEFKRYRLI